ncbi:sensor domain-containing diguanylate cyclase [Deinococcus hohokamensis]|uniref:Diguanylate cyclase domain-containing protein n=1 Tax=Deinococcus hohokamensis TaxID=309883 RepID=A0ABV9I567_9DEIO
MNDLRDLVGHFRHPVTRLRELRAELRDFLVHGEQQEETRLLRRMFLVMALATLLGVPGALWVQAPEFDPLDRVALPLISLMYLVLLPAVVRGRYDPRRAFMLSFLADATYLLLAYSHQFRVFVPEYGVLSQSTFWFAVLYAAAFLIFPTQLARTFVKGLLLLALGITIVHLTLSPELLRHRELLGSVIQFLLSGVVLTTMQSRFGTMRERLGAMQIAASRDALTGAANRRAAEERLYALHGPAPSYAVVLFDIDHFKRVNDEHGHATGDRVLVEVTRCAMALLPESALFARWGGEEFLVVLPEASRAQVNDLIQSLREQLRFHSFGPQHGVTACFGVAHARPGETPDQVVARADEAMYARKHRGRNGVEFSTLTPETALFLVR